MSTAALARASAAARGSAAEIEAHATLGAAGGSESVVGAAGRAGPAAAIRRFLDTARAGVRAGLADQNMLATHLSESVVAYERVEESLARELRAAVDAPAPGATSGPAGEPPTRPRVHGGPGHAGRGPGGRTSPPRTR